MMMDRATAFLRWLKPTHRAFLSTVGSYAVASTFAAAAALVLASTGAMTKGGALVWTILLGFLVYFFAALWVYCEPRAWRLWAAFSVVTGGSVFAVWLLGGDPTFGFTGR